MTFTFLVILGMDGGGASLWSHKDFHCILKVRKVVVNFVLPGVRGRPVAFVDTRLTVGTARRVPCVDNTDDIQTAASRQHWTGKPLKHRLSSLLVIYVVPLISAIKYRSLTSALPPVPGEECRGLGAHRPSLVVPYRRGRLTYGQTLLLHPCPTPSGERGIIDAAPASLGR